jgi:nuclear pore complex protein Nup53
MKLAPSTSAFRKTGKPEKAPPPIQQQPIMPGMSGSVNSQVAGGLAMGQSPNKGMMGQVSDLIFGW